MCFNGIGGEVGFNIILRNPPLLLFRGNFCRVIRGLNHKQNPPTLIGNDQEDSKCGQTEKRNQIDLAKAARAVYTRLQ